MTRTPTKGRGRESPSPAASLSLLTARRGDGSALSARPRRGGRGGGFSPRPLCRCAAWAAPTGPSLSMACWRLVLPRLVRRYEARLTGPSSSCAWRLVLHLLVQVCSVGGADWAIFQFKVVRISPEAPPPPPPKAVWGPLDPSGAHLASRPGGGGGQEAFGLRAGLGLGLGVAEGVAPAHPCGQEGSELQERPRRTRGAMQGLAKAGAVWRCARPPPKCVSWGCFCLASSGTQGARTASPPSRRS